MNAWPDMACKGRKLGYARVSTKEQSLLSQCDALLAAGCDALFDDRGVSGAYSSRPGLDEMLGEVRSGDMIVVYRLDRLGRSVLHLADLLVRFRQEGIHFWSLSEGINTTTPGGKLVYHVFSAVAEFQREIIVENTIAGMNAARRRGKTIGRPPKLTAEQTAYAHKTYMRRKLSKEEIAVRYGISRITLDRAFRRFEAACIDQDSS